MQAVHAAVEKVSRCSSLISNKNYKKGFLVNSGPFYYVGIIPKNAIRAN